jgi:hypothetical protein
MVSPARDADTLPATTQAQIQTDRLDLTRVVSKYFWGN